MIRLEITERILELEQVIESSPYAIAMLDRNMCYLFASARWIADYQLELSNEQLRGRCHYDVFPELPAHWKLVHQRGLNGEVVRSEAEAFPRRDGTLSWVRWEVRPYLDDHGEVGGILIFTEDVTDKKRSESELRDSEERFRGTFDNAAVGVAHVGLDGLWLRVNDKLCQITGYAREDLLAQTFQDITYPEDLETDLAYVRAMIAGSISTYAMEKRYIRSGGTLVWINLTVSLARSAAGEPVYFICFIEDITRRKQAEAALRDSESRFRTLADNMSQLAWMADATGARFWFNQRWIDYTGKVEAAPLRPECQQRIAAGEPWTETQQVTGKDGIPRWFLTQVVPLRDGNGTIYRWFGTSTDITLQREAERTRERAQLFELSLDLVCIVTLDGRFVQTNPAFALILGYAGGELIGRSIAEPAHPDDSPMIADGLGQISHGEVSAQFTSRYRCKDGRYRWLQWRLVPSGDGVIYAVARDVTSERELMESLQSNQERYRLLTDGVRDYALFLLDDVGRVLIWNAGAERLKGYRAEEIIGTDFAIFFTPEDRAGGLPGELLRRATHDGAYELEGWRVRKDGSRFWANVVVTALRDAGGDLRGFAKITRDFTAHHRAAQALHEKQDSLTASLKEREVLLQEVHHRVKNNLQVISSLINMQARQLRDRVALEALGECRARVEAIALIHEKLYQTTDYASVPFGDYARGLVTGVFRTTRSGTGAVRLVFDVDPDVALPVGRAIPCGLILNELITNAMKHAFPAGKDGSVTVSLRRRDGLLLLTVADDGVGMPGGFDVHTSKSLGMHLVTMLVRQLKGQLEVDRSAGTSFRISCSIEAPPPHSQSGRDGRFADHHADRRDHR
ncbi:MAG TPA: PAS domain S-box protein [Kofleriaceae bacterium]|nr:PAS domain S-box protein [Kofleriaceae bacterium]